jgi:multiple sugar transport system ATP-binding protein
MIAGLEDISGGEIAIGGQVVNDVPPKDRDIAMVFQNYALYPHMSVFENMAFGLKLRRFPKAEIQSRVNDAAKILGIGHLLERKPKQLSGGQRQRVAVGRAIVRQPKAFLFDEPLSNLDARMRVEMRAEIKRLHRRLQTTTIYVTHDQEEAMTLGDRIVVMKDGRIQQIADPLTTYNRPANRFVAGFLGTPPMNFFEGDILFEGDAIVFTDGTDRIALPKQWKDKLLAVKNQKAVLGVRPEDLKPGETNGHPTIDVTVEVIEPLGDKMDVYVAAAKHPHIVCRMDARTSLTEGKRVPMSINLDHAHIFAADDEGRNLTL